MTSSVGVTVEADSLQRSLAQARLAVGVALFGSGCQIRAMEGVMKLRLAAAGWMSYFEVCGRFERKIPKTKCLHLLGPL